ncbi:hypothetical protein QJS66_22165 [Kocuria rhizophila]|nr:hypothetical protein QJS66_22165 [Kocuria rhizophila]
MTPVLRGSARPPCCSARSCRGCAPVALVVAGWCSCSLAPCAGALLRARVDRRLRVLPAARAEPQPPRCPLCCRGRRWAALRARGVRAYRTLLHGGGEGWCRSCGWGGCGAGSGCRRWGLPRKAGAWAASRFWLR